MAVQQEIWVDYIQPNLWKGNEFLDKVFSESNKVLQGKIVHLPQAGAKPTVVKNRSSYPATLVKRTDTDVTYTLDGYTTDPTHLEDVEEAELSYSKQESILGEHMLSMREAIGDAMMIKYCQGAVTAGNIVVTSGDVIAATETGQTGNRKACTVADVKALRNKMNKQNVPQTGRYLVLDTEMYSQLTDDLTVTQERDFSKALNEATGVLGKLFGFMVMERSDTAFINTAGDTINVTDAEVLATDDVCGLAFQSHAVAKAVGEIKFFENIGDATLHGDAYSALARFGGRCRRAGAEGVFVLKQAKAA